MHHLVALLAVVLESGIEGFQVDQPAPAELLEKLGPQLDATGSEELRVAAVIEPPGEARLVDRLQTPERTIRLVQFIGGREVRQSWVNIRLHRWTHEVTLLDANFLPDRGLNHKPRLTAGQASAKAEAQMRLREPLAIDVMSAELAYEYEPFQEAGGPGGVLVWVFQAKRLGSYDPYEVSVSSSTGKVIRMRGMWYGCFGGPDWVDLPLSRAEDRY